MESPVPQSPPSETTPGRAEDEPLRFEDVYDANAAFVWRGLRRLGVQDAELDDAMQEVFVVIHRRLPEFEGKSSLKTWIFGIVLRVARTLRRSRARRPTSPIDDGPEIAGSHADAPDQKALEREAVAVLHALLDQLDEDKREAFVLAELEELTAPEIAEALSLNLNTVYARIRAARKAFEQALARYHARGEWRIR